MKCFVKNAEKKTSLEANSANSAELRCKIPFLPDSHPVNGNQSTRISRK